LIHLPLYVSFWVAFGFLLGPFGFLLGPFGFLLGPFGFLLGPFGFFWVLLGKSTHPFFLTDYSNIILMSMVSRYLPKMGDFAIPLPVSK
jgi:hypothetical protein